ncbi:MAG: hypothetical protein FPO08_16380 [Geobacter sp.]|nr:MAG: hypothetical protein FPO08_16380 [Geobacter sp.]
MKKQLIAAVALAGIAAGASIAFAAAGSNGGGILGSKHDMNVFITNNGGTLDTDGRVCAYCHTPHHAADPTLTSTFTATDGTLTTYNIYVPLWSRSVDNGPYDQYVSETFNPDKNNQFYDPLAGPSRLCMTCHDGTIAVDSYYGQTRNSVTAGADDMNYFGTGNFAIGKNFGLANDHPVGFVYDVMQADPNYELNVSTSQFKNGTKTIDSVLSDIQGVTGGKVMTCASCHDVHNGTAVGNTAPASGRGYFLLAPQKDSDICLSCHNK